MSSLSGIAKGERRRNERKKHRSWVQIYQSREGEGLRMQSGSPCTKDGGVNVHRKKRVKEEKRGDIGLDLKNKIEWM